MLSLLQRALAWLLFVIAVSWLKYSLASEQEAVHWVAAVADNASQQIRFTLSAQPTTPNVHKNTLAQISSVTLTGHPDQLFTFCAELRSANGLTKESGIAYIMKGYKARLVPDKLWQCPNSVPGAFRQDFIVSDQPFVAYYSYSQNKTKPDSSKSQLGDRYASVLSMPGLVDRDNIDRMLLYGFGIDNDRGDDSDDKRYGKFLPDGEKNTISLYLQPLFNRLAFLMQQALLVNVSDHSGGRNLVVRQNGREITRIRLTREDVLYLLNNEQMTSIKAVLEWLRFRMSGREKLTHLLLDIQSGLIDHNSPEDEAFQDSVLEQLATVLELDDRDFSFNFEMEQLIKTWSDSASDKIVTHGGGTTTDQKGNKPDKKDSQETGSPEKEKGTKEEKKLPDDGQKGSGRGGGQDNKPSGGQKKEGETTPATIIIEHRTSFTTTYSFKFGHRCYECGAPLDATSTQTNEGERCHSRCVPKTETLTYIDRAAVRELENVKFKCQDCNQELNYLTGTRERSNLVTHALTHLHKCDACDFVLDSPNHEERATALKEHIPGTCYTSCLGCEVVLPGKELITHSRTTCSNRLVTCPVLDCKSEKHCRELIQHISDHLGDQSHTQASATPNPPMSCPLCLGIENNLAALLIHMMKCITTSTCQLASGNGEACLYQYRNDRELISHASEVHKAIFLSLLQNLENSQASVPGNQDGLFLAMKVVMKQQLPTGGDGTQSSQDIEEFKKTYSTLQETVQTQQTTCEELSEKVASMAQQIQRVQRVQREITESSHINQETTKPVGNKQIFPTDAASSVEALQRVLGEVRLQISDLELTMQANYASTYNGEFIWRISEVARRKQDSQEDRITSIYSPPFYTGRNGYKMCIRAYLNGDGIGFRTHFSVFFVLMQGEHDSLLKWPFEHKVSLILVDQNLRKHIVQTFKPSTESSSFKRPTSNMNVASGCPQFTKLSTLDDISYTQGDLIYLKCIVDVTRIFHP